MLKKFVIHWQFCFWFTLEKISIFQIYIFKLFNYKSKLQDSLYLYKNFKKFIL